MKKLGAFLLGVGLIAGATVAADSNTATSVNIVGFSKITAEKGKLIMVSTAFKSMDGSFLKSSNVFGGQGLPTATKVHAYDPTSGQYITDSLNYLGKWGTNITYNGGMGFWLSIPVSAPSNSYDITFLGEVPLENQASNTVYTGLTMWGFPFTASVLWTNTVLAKGSGTGDKLFTFDSATGAYIANSKNYLGKWTYPDMVISPGQGFWYSTTRSLFTNIENKPY
jgi:hypothetical protein